MIGKLLRHILFFSGINFLYVLFSGPRSICLGYHSVTNEKNKKELQAHLYNHLSVPLAVFKKHVAYLKKRGYSFTTFAKLSDLKESDKNAIIYFDDGFRDNFLNVHPFLKQENIHATIFPVVDFVNKESVYSFIKEDPKNLSIFLSWDQVSSMRDVFEIGTHTKSHRKLTKLSDEEIQSEMITSKKFIESKTGKSVTTLSYPHSAFNKNVQRTAKEVGFSHTIANGRGINERKGSFLMKKIPVGPRDTMIDFVVKVGVWYPLFSFFQKS